MGLCALVLRQTIGVVLAAAGCLFAGSGALADGADGSDADWRRGTEVSIEASREAWIGAEAFRGVLSLYVGGTQSIGGNLRQDGFRLRAIAAASRYRYTGLRYSPAIGDAKRVDFRGEARIVDLLAGYQWSAGATTVKVFAGWELAAHAITPFDVETLVQGEASGAKGVLEAWHNLDSTAWVAADLTHARTYGAYSHRLRAGWRASTLVSIGGEASLIGHKENRTQRLGAFLRFDDGTNEISASVGVFMPRGDETGTYATLQWLRRF